MIWIKINSTKFEIDILKTILSCSFTNFRDVEIKCYRGVQLADPRDEEQTEVVVSECSECVEVEEKRESLT